MSDAVLIRAASLERQAVEIIASLNLLERWSKFGAPRIVGSAAYGLMVVPDIDIEIYCPEPTVDAGFSVVSDLARDPRVWKVRFSNELAEENQGLYWQIRYRNSDEEIWKIDMWLLADAHPGPRSVDLIEPMRRVLTDESRVVILTFKELMQDRADIHSIDIYRAVIDDGVRNASDFARWLEQQKPGRGLTFWQPA
ncbi:MAG TPA: hypothetical protein VF963_01080 [Gaiellaceae bacterium]